MHHKTAISLAGTAAMACAAAPAHAYLDPATGSIILQSVIGAIAGATLFFRTSLYKVKEFFTPGRSGADKSAADDE